LSNLYGAIAASNMSVGGKAVVHNNTECLVRGVGWLRGVKDLENVVVASRQGVPVRVAAVAAVQLGPEFRRSALEKGGQEAVGGVVIMRVGQNPLEVTRAVKEKIRQLQAGLPEGVRVVPFYERTRRIESAIHTVTGTLREEIVIACIAILLILTHVRSAIVVCVTLPASALPSGGVGLAPSMRPVLPRLVIAAVVAVLVLAIVLAHWRTVAVGSLIVIAFLADTRFHKLGSEFMPELNEGSVMDMPLTAPRVAMSQAVDDVIVRDRVLNSFPEVEQVVGKIGRAETATDPSPVDMVETVVSLRPPEWWPKRKIEFRDALAQAAVVAG
jgi:Cu/Ag efflux pump CusA